MSSERIPNNAPVGEFDSREQLRVWLVGHNADYHWQEDVKNGQLLQGWILGKSQLVLVMLDTGCSNGWELYVPPSLSCKITETLQGANKLLGFSPDFAIAVKGGEAHV